MPILPHVSHPLLRASARVAAPFSGRAFARARTGARVGAAAVDAARGGKSYITTETEVVQRFLEIRNEIAFTKKAIGKWISKKWGPDGFSATVTAAQLAEFQSDKKEWGPDSQYGVFLHDFEKFTAKNYKSPGESKDNEWHVRTAEFWESADYPLLGDLYDATERFKVRNDKFIDAYMKESGLPNPLVPTPTAKEVQTSAETASGDKGTAGIGHITGPTKDVNFSNIFEGVKDIAILAVVVLGAFYLFPLFGRLGRK